MDKTRVVVVAFNRLEKLILSGIATHVYPIPTTINHTLAVIAVVRIGVAGRHGLAGIK